MTEKFFFRMNHFPINSCHFQHYPKFMSSNFGQIPLNHHHRYDISKENYQKKIDLDTSNSSNDFEFDEMLTTTSEEMKSDYFLMDKKKIKRRKSSFENQFKSRIGPLTKFHSFSTIYTPNDSSEDDYMYEKRRKPPRKLEMIQEISPIQHVSSDQELPPPMPLKMTREFQPLQTSTTTSFYPPMMPKTNPRTMPNTPRNQKINLDEIRTGFFEKQRNRGIVKPEHFGLPSQLAKQHGSKGILYLSIAVNRRMGLRVMIRNAIFFLDPCQPINSYVVVEIKRKPTSSRKRLKPARQRLFDEVRTSIVFNNNSPKYSEDFRL